MINIKNNFLKSTIFKIASYNSLQVAIRIISGLITTKVIAQLLGQSGVALLGNFRNFITSLETVATIGFQNGIVKYIAENKENQSYLLKLITTVFISVLLVVFLLSIILFFGASTFNIWIFGSNYKFDLLFKILAFALPFYILNIIIISIINGLNEYRKVINLNIIGNVLGLVLTIGLVWYYETIGALTAIAITPAILFFLSYFYISKKLEIKEYFKFKNFEINTLKNLSHYTLMAGVSAFILPMVYLIIRKNAIDVIGIENAGNWEAVNRLSNFYLMFISSLLTLYYFPKLSQANSTNQTNTIFKNYFFNIIPVFIVGLTILYVLKDFVIKFLYTDSFLGMNTLLAWQMLGDVFKVCALIFGYQLFAKRKTALFLLSELISISILFISSNYLIKIYNTQGLVMAHCMTYLLYLIMMMVLYLKFQNYNKIISD